MVCYLHGLDVRGHVMHANICKLCCNDLSALSFDLKWHRYIGKLVLNRLVLIAAVSRLVPN